MNFHKQDLGRVFHRSWLDGRASWFTEHQAFRIEWHLFTSRLMLGIQVNHRATGNDELEWRIGIPWLISLYLGIQKVGWLPKLLGITPEKKGYADLERELDFHIERGEVYLSLWTDPWGEADRHYHFDLKSLLLGQRKLQYVNVQLRDVILWLPEGPYKGEAILKAGYDYHERQLWPARKFFKVFFTFKSGIPIPTSEGPKLIYEYEFIANTIVDGLERVKQRVTMARLRNSGYHWVPNKTHTLPK